MPPRRRTGAVKSGCPPCSYKRVGKILATPKEGESLQELSPSVAASWHPTRNSELRPSDVMNASKYRAWWICDNPGCGHEWRTSVANRTSGNRTGCPSCSRSEANAAEPGQSFGDLHPDLLAEWHRELNAKLDPFRLRPASSVQAWWKCRDCGHEWQTTIGLRTTARTGCSPCSYRKRGLNRQTPKGGQSLAALYPHVLAEWNWDRNSDLDPHQLKPGSDLIVWWVCERGHHWQANVYRRTADSPNGCPTCVHIPEPGQSFADLNPGNAREWHPTKNGEKRPDELKPGSAYKAWWKCLARGHEWQASVTHRNGSNASACPRCTMWSTSASQIRIAYELIAAGVPIALDHPKIPVPGRRPVAADMVVPDYKLIIEYDGSYHHARSESVEKDRQQSRHLEAAGWVVLRIRPQAIEPVDENSIEVANGASIKQIAIATLRRIKSMGYPASRSRAYEREPELWAAAEADAAVLNLKSRSLLTEFPEIAAEWHPTRNGIRTPDDVEPGSKNPAWWLCGHCGHEWRVRPGHRTTGGTGCPNCAAAERAVKVRTPKPGNSVAEVHPRLLKLLHPEKNGDIDLYQVNAGTILRLWWLCPDCGHEWQTDHPRNTGCRPCANRRRAAERTTPDVGESLVDLHPKLADQWHPTKNGEVGPNQVKESHSKAVWWLCGECGREWKISPRQRVVAGAGCRRCSSQEAGKRRRTPGPGESLAETYPAVAAEWDAIRNGELTPSDVKPETTQHVWWECSNCGYGWKSQIATRTKRGHGCKRCASAKLSSAKRKPKQGQSLADVKPAVLILWHPTRNVGLAPTELTPSSHTKVWWLCPDCGNEWQATPRSPGCRSCSMKRVGKQQAQPRPGTSLAERFPELAEQWDAERNAPVTAAGVSARSSTKFWWRCVDCKHRWQARPANLTNQRYLCAKCRKRRDA